jgi:SAM-dependent methyltransferase
MKERACPACGSTTPEFLNEVIVYCNRCSHQWLVRDLESQSRIEKKIYTSNYAGYRDDPRLFESFDKLINDIFLQRVPITRSILDVGCGGGAFLKAASNAGYNAVGLDVAEAAALMCRERGLSAQSGDFLEFTQAEAFGAVTFWDVFEHLRQPAQFLQHGLSLLASGGILVGKLPMFGALSVGLSKRIPRAGGILLGMPEHIQFFNERSLSAMLNSTGCKWEFLTLAGGAMRSPSEGGPITKRAARLVKAKLSSLSGDQNALFCVELP